MLQSREIPVYLVFALNFIKLQVENYYFFFEIQSLNSPLTDKPLLNIAIFFGHKFHFVNCCFVNIISVWNVFCNQKKKNGIASKIQSMNLTAFENSYSNNKWFFLYSIHSYIFFLLNYCPSSK